MGVRRVGVGEEQTVHQPPELTSFPLGGVGGVSNAFVVAVLAVPDDDRRRLGSSSRKKWPVMVVLLTSILSRRRR